MAERIRHTIGKSFRSAGSISPIVKERFVLDKNRQYFVFDVIPIGKLRMTQRDKRWDMS